MKTKLVLLENPIIISDETPNKLYEGFYFIDSELFHTSKTMLQTGCKEVIAQSHQIDWNGLEAEFGYVDTYKLFCEVDGTCDRGQYEHLLFDSGFKKAQELNDKKFSLEEYELSDLIRLSFLKHGRNSWLSISRDVIEGLSQPKVFDIEVEMEGCSDCHLNDGYMYSPNCCKNIKPKTFEGTQQLIKILRKFSKIL